MYYAPLFRGLSDSVELNYLLVKSKKRKKTISLQLRKDGSVVIQAPWRISGREIDLFFQRKKDWLYKKIGEAEKHHKEVAATNFSSGETFYYLGFPYPLIIERTNNSLYPLNFSGQQFILDSEFAHRAKELFIEWYVEQAKKYIEEKVRHYSGILKLFPTRVRIGSARSRWGACSPDNRLSFTWRLIQAPGPVIDYVVAHELSHIKEKNHSNRFWNLVERAVPDYGTHRLWLRKKGHILQI